MNIKKYEQRRKQYEQTLGKTFHLKPQYKIVFRSLEYVSYFKMFFIVESYPLQLCNLQTIFLFLLFWNIDLSITLRQKISGKKYFFNQYAHIKVFYIKENIVYKSS